MAEPLSVADAKAHLRVIDNTTEDSLIGTYISAARRWVEDYTGHILMARDIDVQFSAWGDYLPIWLQPVSEIGAINYTDADGEDAEFSAYGYAAGQYPLKLYPTDVFPELGTNGTITVPVTAGYASPSDIPEPLMQAIKVLLTAMFKNRGGGWEEAEPAAKMLCRLYRMPAVA